MCWPSSPPLSAKRARTSETYWRPSKNGMRCCKSLSVGSFIQPCIGIALSMWPSVSCCRIIESRAHCALMGRGRFRSLTLMEHVAERAIVQDHDLTQIRLDGTQVLDKGSVSKGTVLPVVPCREELPLRFQPVDHWISIFLNRGREHYEIEPLADLACCVSILLLCSGRVQQQTAGCHSPVAGNRRNAAACGRSII